MHSFAIFTRTQRATKQSALKLSLPRACMQIQVLQCYTMNTFSMPFAFRLFVVLLWMQYQLQAYRASADLSPQHTRPFSLKPQTDFRTTDQARRKFSRRLFFINNPCVKYIHVDYAKAVLPLSHQLEVGSFVIHSVKASTGGGTFST